MGRTLALLIPVIMGSIIRGIVSTIPYCRFAGWVEGYAGLLGIKLVILGRETVTTGYWAWLPSIVTMLLVAPLPLALASAALRRHGTLYTLSWLDASLNMLTLVALAGHASLNLCDGLAGLGGTKSSSLGEYVMGDVAVEQVYPLWLPGILLLATTLASLAILYRGSGGDRGG